jgi:hypothetical protein
LNGGCKKSATFVGKSKVKKFNHNYLYCIQVK